MPKGLDYSEYPLLNDYAWLYQQYIVNGLSTNDLAQLSGAKTANSARQALIRHNILVRNTGTGLRIKHGDDGFVMDMSVFTGCLLGDASMTAYNRRSDASMPEFRKKNKYLDHVQYVAKILFPRSWRKHIKYEANKFRGKIFDAYILRSFTHPELMPLYRAWYPPENNYVKVVPQDIPMDATVLLHWFMDDGWSRMRNRGYQEVLIGLETQSFTLPDVQRLCTMLKDKFDLGFKPTPEKSRVTGVMQWKMRLPQKQAEHFFEVIGDCPVPSLEYKWKLKPKETPKALITAETVFRTSKKLVITRSFLDKHSNWLQDNEHFKLDTHVIIDRVLNKNKIHPRLLVLKLITSNIDLQGLSVTITEQEARDLATLKRTRWFTQQ